LNFNLSYLSCKPASVRSLSKVVVFPSLNL